MAETRTNTTPAPSPGIRWWPALVLVVLAVGAGVWVRAQADWPFQKRNLTVLQIVLITGILLLVWWTFFSRVRTRLRLAVTFSLVGLLVVGAALFRIGGVSGDLLPILEYRWATRVAPAADELATPGAATPVTLDASALPAFPQFLGPNRDGVLPGPLLDTNWTTHPPEVVWRRPVGAAWSGFAFVGNVAITQEQRGAEEFVVAYQLTTGQPLWQQGTPARYATTIAGEGPRATPTIAGKRLFAFGATGMLNCLDLATGNRLWTRDVLAEFGGKLPDWGFASSPLVVDDLVIVHGSEGARHSLHAFRAEDGAHVWSGGAFNASYASPSLATLAGVPQVLAFNDGSISGHNPASGATLWERPWGNGNVVCASPVVVDERRVVFSSGYGVGAELLEITRAGDAGKLSVERVWRSIRMKAKFAHLFVTDGCLFGLDDGILAAVNLADGSLRWKEGRYGHGQGLRVGEFYLLMAESGELVLLRPTPDAPNELTRFRVFNAKTWNPPALAGDWLLVRNDREAAALRLKTVAAPEPRM